ncbi:putative NAD dependent epimerase/dehydratase [Hypoxylon trugodes]|uniref:putative NAD dependent epimerase/dehydratase n=1 Tax=Hypoxylon trugodes TaxID=326681 RepID=UPI00218EB2F7|nr:putative NAD dependent epimerase/dehydratase [Hypoxylon trugodes]KAI1385376.1 putative NAD dependent epimerase/dehydratase [Hypoxylon trugodes]
MADTTKKERIFMTGASGYIGSRITEFAIAQGYEVYGLSRSEASDEILKKLGAVPVRGDLTTLDVIRRESAAADIVMHLADPFRGKQGVDYQEVIDDQKAISDAIADGIQGTNKPLVMTSGTLMAEADPNGGITDETAPYPENPVVRRHIVEQYDLSLAKKGIRVSTIRLSPYVYGRGGSGLFHFLHIAAKNSQVLAVNEGKQHTSAVHVDDAARLYILAAQKAKAGSIFNATESTDLTARQVFDAMAEALQVPVQSFTLEEAKGKVGPFFAAFLAAASRASSEKAHKELGWEIQEKAGIVEDIKTGSYKALADQIRNKTATPYAGF